MRKVKGIKYKIGSARKKGSVVIEMIAAIPVLVFMTWGIINLMMYATAASQLNEAAYETSRAIAMDLRGHELEVLSSDDVPPERIKEKIGLIIERNNLIRIDKNETSYDNLPINYTRESCREAMANESVEGKNVICVYTESNKDNAINNQNNYQIRVEIRTDYRFSGGWGENFSSIRLRAGAVSQVELPGRGNYVEF